MGEAWLVTGIPGVGKSTVAHRLAQRFARGVYIPGDQVHDMIVSGQVEPDGESRLEAERQIGLTQRNCCQTPAQLHLGRRRVRPNSLSRCRTE